MDADALDFGGVLGVGIEGVLCLPPLVAVAPIVAKFREVALILRRRSEQLLRVPLTTLDRRALQARLQEIGQEV